MDIPYDLTKEVEELADRLRIKQYIQTFQAKHKNSTDPKKIVSQCWDLGTINKRYIDFIAKYRPKMEYHLRRLNSGENIEPSDCFVERFNLIHEYRKFPYLDPDLPQELLPENWLRPQAAALFDEYHNSLTEKANEYFDIVSNNYQSIRRSKQDIPKILARDSTKKEIHSPVSLLKRQEYEALTHGGN